MPRRAKQSPSPQEGVTEFLRSTALSWQDLIRRFPKWEPGRADEPVYAITPEALDAFEGKAFFSTDALEAERKFSDFCKGNGIVGMWRGQTITFPLMIGATPSIRSLPQATLDETGLRGQEARLDSLTNRATAASDRQLGVIGWLLTEPMFLRELEALKVSHAALAPTERPRFPMTRLSKIRLPNISIADVKFPPPFDQRLVTIQHMNEPAPESEAVVGFRALLNGLLDKWGLACLATWDLPLPQGPLLPNLFPPGSHLHPAHGVNLHLPIHYPLQGDDQLLKRIRDLQREQAATLGLPPSFGGISHHQQYAQMFRVLHLDLSILSRLREKRPGLVGVIEIAGANAFGISTGQVRKLRHAITACRKGKRASVPFLSE
ncbi:MAG: hypothetical protein U0791_06960 [Gemmataceae bacterium]